MSQENIVDASKPNSGRIYDYFLGGSHNFEVDRQAGDQILKIMPFLTKYSRLQRWALQDIAIELTERRGFDMIVDFASGLPTMDHIHHKVPKGTTVIYSDYDPVVVEYAKEILGNTPNVYFFHGDARYPEALLCLPEVEKILAGRRKVAFVYWGFSAYMTEEETTHVAHALYDWSAPSSCWAFNVQSGNRQSEASKAVVELYRKLGTQLYVRTPDETQKLLEPWKVEGNNWIPLLEWHGFSQSELGKEEVEGFGPMGGGYGAYLIK